MTSSGTDSRPVKRAGVEGGSSPTSRQLVVMQLIYEGLSNKEIAVRIGISEPAVRKHAEALFRRYRVHSRTALLRAALEAGALKTQGGPNEQGL